MSEPIRVLQVFAQMNRGGAETMIMNLYRNINRNKVQFDFVVHTEEKCAFDDEIEKLGGKIFRVPKYNGKNHFLYVNVWKEIIQAHPEYELIHGHIRSTASIYLKICKNYNRITIAHSHSTSSGRGIVSKIKDIMQYPIKYTADYFFSCSNSAGKWLFGEGIVENNNFHVLNNSIDSSLFTFNKQAKLKVRNEFGIKDEYVIGHIGRFVLAKNHEFIIEVFKKVHEINQNVILLLVGDGELRKEIESKVEKLGLINNVIFTGNRSDIPNLLSSMDVFLYPSLFEGLPVSLVEAQASGIMSILSDTISKEVKISNQIKFLSLDENSDIWAKEVIKYVDGYERENMYSQIKRAGYDIDESAKWLEEFYLKEYANK